MPRKTVLDLTLLLPFLLLVLFVSPGFAQFDLCIFFGTCNNNNNNRNIQNGNNNNNFNARNDPGPDFVQVDGDWIEPKTSGSGNILYHFGSGRGNTDWYSADAYCSEKGGYLAEPSSIDEHTFIVSYARRFGKANWWIGLRLTEDCQCIGGNDANGRSLEATKSTFEASLDFDSLVERSAERSPVKTVCPPAFQKVCVGPNWRWGYSTQKPTFTKWSLRTGEPNGRQQENCVALWFEYEYEWSDWTCLTANAGPHPFKPVCQKDKPTNDNTGKRDVEHQLKKASSNVIKTTHDYDDDDNRSVDVDAKIDALASQEESVRCVESGVVYRAREADIVGSIVRVDSAELCRDYCAEEPMCRFWTWFGFGPKQKCIMKSKLRTARYRYSKPGAISGTMLNNCKDKDKVPTPRTLESDFYKK